MCQSLRTQNYFQKYLGILQSKEIMSVEVDVQTRKEKDKNHKFQQIIRVIFYKTNICSGISRIYQRRGANSRCGYFSNNLCIKMKELGSFGRGISLGYANDLMSKHSADKVMDGAGVANERVTTRCTCAIEINWSEECLWELLSVNGLERYSLGKVILLPM